MLNRFNTKGCIPFIVTLVFNLTSQCLQNLSGKEQSDIILTDQAYPLGISSYLHIPAFFYSSSSRSSYFFLLSDNLLVEKAVFLSETTLDRHGPLPKVSQQSIIPTNKLSSPSNGKHAHRNVLPDRGKRCCCFFFKKIFVRDIPYFVDNKSAHQSQGEKCKANCKGSALLFKYSDLWLV